MDAVISDAANLRAFSYVENDDFGVRLVGRVFDAQFYILEELCVPQRLEIPPQSFFVVGIAFAAEDPRFERIAANSAVTQKFDALNHSWRLAVVGLLWSLWFACCN